MGPKDDLGLAWEGQGRRRTSGGFVDGVGLNERTDQLALDPDGVVAEESHRSVGRAGPNLDVERIGDGRDGPVQPNGRVRLP